MWGATPTYGYGAPPPHAYNTFTNGVRTPQPPTWTPRSFSGGSNTPVWGQPSSTSGEGSNHSRGTPFHLLSTLPNDQQVPFGRERRNSVPATSRSATPQLRNAAHEMHCAGSYANQVNMNFTAQPSSDAAPTPPLFPRYPADEGISGNGNPTFGNNEKTRGTSNGNGQNGFQMMQRTPSSFVSFSRQRQLNGMMTNRNDNGFGTVGLQRLNSGFGAALPRINSGFASGDVNHNLPRVSSAFNQFDAPLRNGGFSRHGSFSQPVDHTLDRPLTYDAGNACGDALRSPADASNDVMQRQASFMGPPLMQSYGSMYNLSQGGNMPFGRNGSYASMSTRGNLGSSSSASSSFANFSFGGGSFYGNGGTPMSGYGSFYGGRGVGEGSNTANTAPALQNYGSTVEFDGDGELSPLNEELSAINGAAVFGAVGEPPLDSPVAKPSSKLDDSPESLAWAPSADPAPEFASRMADQNTVSFRRSDNIVARQRTPEGLSQSSRLHATTQPLTEFRPPHFTRSISSSSNGFTPRSMPIRQGYSSVPVFYPPAFAWVQNQQQQQQQQRHVTPQQQVISRNNSFSDASSQSSANSLLRGSGRFQRRRGFSSSGHSAVAITDNDSHTMRRSRNSGRTVTFSDEDHM